MKVTAEDLERVQKTFEQNFERHAEVGAALSIWSGEEEILSLTGGVMDRETNHPWSVDTLVLIWSATKGLASASVLHALEKNNIALEKCVAEIWPAFAHGGKEKITFRQFLSHQSGLSALGNTSLSILDHEGVIAAIEMQAPRWTPGEGHGYGPRTYGFIADEIVRRLTGIPLGEYWRAEFGEPLELDTWIGLPADLHDRVARILSPRSAGCNDGSDPFLEAMADPQSLTRAAFISPTGLAGATLMNSPVARSASIPSLGGISSAASLAKFYALLAGDGTWKGCRYFQEASLVEMRAPLVQGQDKVLCLETAFAAGFMKDPVDENGIKLRKHFGPSLSAFGHPGAGGSLAFADPEHKIGFAYVMNQMESGVLPGKRALNLVDSFYNISY
ncbi:MAG: serine hydrolase domain-containing protein [Chthoniobacterales bacterium]